MPPSEPHSDVTRLLNEAEAGNEDARGQLMPLVYQQLQVIARQRMSDERKGHTLQATALVHEAFLRLVGRRHTDWSSRGHFYLAAAEAMRRILIEHARKRGRIKRGGNRQRVPINVVDLAEEHDSLEILAMDEALQRLEEEDPRAADVVRLRFFAGLDVEETAQAMGLSARTVMRDWTYARAWLFQALRDRT